MIASTFSMTREVKTCEDTDPLDTERLFAGI